ncbi:MULTISPECIES: Trm112 family protein [unclassified Modestobacter]|uniref:Trm112 family protein n=1 Tax=unclassified Modestobacter TaxID=2643866 RepID=UPI0022AA35D3|nr:MULTISPECIES: Trm112 family protein [unclassified Modestobacter]MCZ2823806.1 Trm112 family protein [Modestobacter sp. VKM Ac-2981]MCZ2852051.1 Trm112 family protein [Modestobacter sp. VKM Ac-2982]
MSGPATGGGTLGIDPELLAILACPDTHHTPLTVDVGASELVCPTCSRAYPVRDGIPVLLLDEARQRSS